MEHFLLSNNHPPRHGVLTGLSKAVAKDTQALGRVQVEPHRRAGLGAYLRITRNRRRLLIPQRLRTWTGRDWLRDAARLWAIECSPDQRRSAVRSGTAEVLSSDPIELEQRVLGALLRVPDRHGHCVLRSADFVEDIHARIFTAMRVLRTQERAPTAPAVANYAEQFGHLGFLMKAGDIRHVSPFEIWVVERLSVPGYILSLELTF